jgi:Endosomal/lysosomal potassium channel TMEM175
VPSDDDTPPPRRAISKGRMEGFSDGVFGFAATLLGVDLAIHPPGTALHQVLHAWPSYLAYVISFLTIGAAWLAHTSMTDRLMQTDPLHSSSGERVFVAMFGLTLLAIRVLGATLDLYAQHERLYSASAVGEDLRIDRRKRLPVIAAFLVVLLIGLALPGLAIALYFAIVVYAIVPFGYVTRLLFGRKPPRSPS